MNFIDCFFEEYLNIKFQKFRQKAAELFPVDRHEEASSRFSQFCERA
jgi:hypothetical protein